MSTIPVIEGAIAMKLPKEVSAAAALQVAAAASVFLPPAATEPSEISLFVSTGDSSPVIFWPATVRVTKPPRSVYEGEPPIVPAALAAAGPSPTKIQRNRPISLFLCPTNQGDVRASASGPERAHQEGYLFNALRFVPQGPRNAGGNFADAQKTLPTFHFQEDQ